ncbi:MAG: aminopeptidase N C-terminal domain-containing protein [Nitrospira sp.]
MRSRSREQQYRAADNMTDRMAALGTLSLHDGAGTRGGDRRFLRALFERSADHRQVVFAAGEIPEPGTLDRVRELTEHPAFSIANPNRVRALIGAFAQANPTQFNRADGAGYDFVADTMLALDPAEPAGRRAAATAFRSWRALEPDRRAKAPRRRCDASRPRRTLSRDLNDIVERAARRLTRDRVEETTELRVTLGLDFCASLTKILTRLSTNRLDSYRNDRGCGARSRSCRDNPNRGLYGARRGANASAIRFHQGIGTIGRQARLSTSTDRRACAAPRGPRSHHRISAHHRRRRLRADARPSCQSASSNEPTISKTSPKAGARPATAARTAKPGAARIARPRLRPTTGPDGSFFSNPDGLSSVYAVVDGLSDASSSTFWRR